MQEESKASEKTEQESSSSFADPGLLPVDEHVEEVNENGKKVRRRGVYLLPNLFTTGALFCGFYSVIAGMNGHFDVASIAIFIAMVLDGLDGRVARLTNTTSAFGEQYDSISDMVSFGMAPALLVFNWAVSSLGKAGWVVAFLYAACAALRLARFNTQIGKVDSRYFIGLASPAAAAIIAGIVWVGFDVQMNHFIAIPVAVITAFAGLLMVSNIRYSSFKGFDVHGRVPFVVLILVLLVFALVTIDPPSILLALFALYGASGPVQWLWRRVKPG